MPGVKHADECSISFCSKISISWTLGQYYVTDGFQKVYVRGLSNFHMEYAQSLKNVLRGNSSYSKLEFDINQNIRFDLMRKLNYHAGFGFSQSERRYFKILLFCQELFS